MTVHRYRRSTLFAPAHSRSLLEKMKRCHPDCVVLDLEDGTPPALKAQARGVAERALHDIDFGNAERIVRINAIDSDYAGDDLAWLGSADVRADAVMIPKVQDAAGIEAVAIGTSYRFPLWILPTETAVGYRNLVESVGHPAVTAVVWAAEDFAADIGADGSREPDGQLREVFRIARAQTLLAAKGAGLSAIDTTYVDLRDLDGLRREAAHCAALGFDGKAAIHPAHITVINEVFRPRPEDLERARRLVAAFEAAGGGAIRFDNQMVDAPHYRQALRLLARTDTG